jgi:PAS domain S-box-containing protein
MTGAYTYTPGIWPPLATAIFVAALGLYTWRRRNVPAGKPFVAISLFATLMLLGIALEVAAIASATKIIWYKFQFVMQMLAVTGGTCFTLEYANPGRWLTRRNLTLLAVPPLLTVLLILINDSQFIWRRLEFRPDGSVAPYYALPGAILLAYAWCLVLLNTAAFLWLFIRSPQHRWPVALMLFGQIAGRVIYLFDIAHLRSPTLLDLTVFAVLAPWTAYAVALFGFRIFDPLPAARATALEQMCEGMVVFDSTGRVVSLNRAAERILDVRSGFARGKTWQQLFPAKRPPPAWPDVNERPGLTAEEVADMTFGGGSEVRHYAPALSPLQDHREVIVGHLLLLRDVTEQREAQARLLEQQCVLATLRERERLARELHDSAGQILAYVSVQAQAVARLVHDGDAITAEAQLRRLAEAAQEAHADLRESILGLRAGPVGDWAFLAALRHYLAGFSAQSGIVTELAVQPGLGEAAFPASSGIQMLRVIQEALTNARKHSGAHRVWVTLEQEKGEAVIVVEDDGAGFDPNGFDPGKLAAGHAGGHYGLAFMADRMAEIGGRLTIESEPGAGTRVVLHAPIRSSGEEGA